MKLTEKQIQRINNYLDAREVNYVDIRIEVFDHIAIDIEEQLESGCDFDVALILSIEK